MEYQPLGTFPLIVPKKAVEVETTLCGRHCPSIQSEGLVIRKLNAQIAYLS
jgi:hypothetical protein